MPAVEGSAGTAGCCAPRDRRGPFPGLILEWKHQGGTLWSARVAYVIDPGRASSAEEWFARDHLRPVDSWPSARVQKEAGALAEGMAVDA
ncbi:hypothetical protein OG558_12695 [Kribbella sp. NBC_01510]|uniref:hypothetical protein n=1 Tax=Kribbella sp. NBC_01510 TaxID=2903581 RepID=UPI003864A85E